MLDVEEDVIFMSPIDENNKMIIRGVRFGDHILVHRSFYHKTGDFYVATHYPSTVEFVPGAGSTEFNGAPRDKVMWVARIISEFKEFRDFNTMMEFRSMEKAKRVWLIKKVVKVMSLFDELFL